MTDQGNFTQTVPKLAALAATALAEPFDLHSFLECSDELSQALQAGKGPHYDDLLRHLIAGASLTEQRAAKILKELAHRLAKDSHVARLKKELGTEMPFDIQRHSYRAPLFETWAPLGVVVHVAAEGFFPQTFEPLVTSLLAGNFNLVLASPASCGFFEAFGNSLTGAARRYRVVAAEDGEIDEALDMLLGAVDAVVSCQEEELVRWRRRLADAAVLLLDRRPATASVFVARSHIDAAAAPDQLAQGVLSGALCERDAAPILYLETEDSTLLERWAQALAGWLGGECEVQSLADAEACTYPPGVLQIWAAPRRSLVAPLRSSKPRPRHVDLWCEETDLATLARLFFAAGVSRVRQIGDDGKRPPEPAWSLEADLLSPYLRRVSLGCADPLRGLARLSQLEPRRPAKTSPARESTVRTRACFTPTSYKKIYGEIFLRTGGSTGEPALASYTYDSFDVHTQAAGEALYAAGLDPATDRVMNVFAAGGLYSGFIGFFKALESIGARQFPMAMDPSWEMVGETIVKYEINVLVGMPAYILQLFKVNDELFQEYRGIEKIFYSGDHFAVDQTRHLKERYGVRILRVGHYGSIDAGTLGFQCEACEGSILHLHEHIQGLEILDREEDRPTAPGEVGRLVFTNHVHSPESMERYDTGDLGRWVDEPCPCGRTTPRFELLGRESDWFKVAGYFMNYWRLVTLLQRQLSYVDDVQLRIDRHRDQEKLTICLTDDKDLDPAEARQVVLTNWTELNDVVSVRKMFDLEVSCYPAEKLERSPTSGKTLHVIDLRRPLES